MQFSDAQPSVLVYDSGTSVGLFLTQELIGKGLKVHLLLSEASANSSLYESIVKDKNLFEIHEFSGDCLSNYNAIIFPHQPQKIFIPPRSEEHTSELQSRENLVCRLPLEKKK